MTRPTAADIAFIRSTLPAHRVAAHRPASSRPFATVLHQVSPAGGADVSRSQILQTAQQLMGIPYVWGGTSTSGMDCSAFVSKAWGVPRQTTDTLSSVARPISKDELQPGDALNLTTGADPEGYGHVRLFDSWADAAHTRMWVYEQTVPRSVHHVIPYDDRYQPMRRLNLSQA